MRVTLIQRVVPHYRVPLFQRLHDELGWVVAAGTGPVGNALNTPAVDPPWLHRFDFHRDARRQYGARVPLAEIRAALRPDAIVAEFSLHMSSTWALAMARKARRPLLAFWSQGWNTERGFVRPADLASQAVRLMLLARADAQLCYSDAGAAYLRRHLPGRPRAFVAANTLAVETMPGRDVDRSPADPAAAHLVWIGRVTPDKRVPMLVRAFGRALARMPRLKLTIVGEGPDLDRVRAEAARLPAGAVTLLGAVYDDAATARLLQEASLYVSAGSVGLGVNHALAYGVPVMMFDDPVRVRHHPEHIYVVDGVTGWRVSGGTEEALAAALVRVLGGATAPKHVLRAQIADYVRDYASLGRMMDGFRELHACLAALHAARSR